MNTNYEKGRKKEYKIKKKFELMGYTVLRMAGSKGFADLVAIDKLEKEIVFIQCKPDNLSTGKKLLLEDSHRLFTGNFKCSFEVI